MQNVLAGWVTQGTVEARGDVGSPDCQTRLSSLHVDTQLKDARGAQGHSSAFLMAGLEGAEEASVAWPSDDRAASAAGGCCGAPGLLLEAELGLETSAQTPEGVQSLV